MEENMYVVKVVKYIGVKAKNVDDALYKYREGFVDLVTNEEVLGAYQNNDLFYKLDEPENYEEYESEE